MVSVVAGPGVVSEGTIHGSSRACRPMASRAQGIGFGSSFTSRPRVAAGSASVDGEPTWREIAVHWLEALHASGVKMPESRLQEFEDVVNVPGAGS